VSISPSNAFPPVELAPMVIAPKDIDDNNMLTDNTLVPPFMKIVFVVVVVAAELTVQTI
jgi:hypothetical protein